MDEQIIDGLLLMVYYFDEFVYILRLSWRKQRKKLP